MINWQEPLKKFGKIKNGNSGDRKKLIKVLFIVVWVGFLLSILWGAWHNHQVILPYLERANPIYLIGVFVSYFLSLSTVVIVWGIIMTSFKVPVNFKTNSQVYCLTLAARRLPGTIWYVGGRLIVYQRLKVVKSIVLLASIIEFILLLISGGITGVLFFSLADEIKSFLAILIIIGILAISYFFIRPLSIKYISNIGSLEVFRSISALSILGWLMIYMTTWIMGGMMVIYLIKIFQVVELSDFPFVIGAWAISGVAGALTFFLPSSFGIPEISLTALLSWIMPFPLAGIIAISARLITLTLEVLLSLALVPFSVRLTKENSPTTGDGQLDSKAS
jgi:uncharacterized membrane protein YbhN (UPF0104 family)